MAPKTKEKFEEQKLEKRKIIMQAALEVFASHGYHGASVSHIASQAGVSKGLIYTYFSSKEEMLQAIVFQGAEKIIEIFEPAIKEELTPELFKKLLSLYFLVLRNNTSFWRLYFSIALQPQVAEMIEKEVSGISGDYLHLLESYYRKQGSKDPEADSIISHAILDGITLNFILNHHNFDFSYVEKLVTDQILQPRFK